MQRLRCHKCVKGFCETLMYNLIDDNNITTRTPESIHISQYIILTEKQKQLYERERLICGQCKGKTIYITSD